MVCVDLSGDYTSISWRQAQEARSLEKQLETEGFLCQDPMRMVRAERMDRDSSETRQAVAINTILGAGAGGITPSMENAN